MTNTVPKIDVNNIEFVNVSQNRRNSIVEFVQEWNNNSETLLIKSSGSTGKPKEFNIQKKYFIASAELSGTYFNYQKDQSIVLSLSIDTIGGKMQVIRALIFEMKLFVLENERNPLLHFDQKATHISLVPLQVEEIIKHSPEKFSLFNNVLIGGAAINPSLEEEIKSISGNFFESYGMTETLSHIAIREIKKENYFTVLDGVTIIEHEGCLVISAPTLSIFDLKTNDLVEIISEKQFRILGRKDLVINSGGYKFHPELLERKLSPFLKDSFFFIGEKNNEYGEIITLYIEDDYTSQKVERINELLGTYFSKYEVPKKMYFVEEFIRSESNKILRFETQHIVLDTE
jgi:O-succinylbenzoic acid--CoA ligase